MEWKFNNYAEYNQKQTQIYEKFTNHFIAAKKTFHDQNETCQKQ